jgi:hypothetical protein
MTETIHECPLRKLPVTSDQHLGFGIEERILKKYEAATTVDCVW